MGLALQQPFIERRVNTVSMKRTDLEKNKAIKLMEGVRHSGVPGRFAQGSTQVPDRRERRKAEQAAGLVPLAVKVHNELVRQLQDMATAQGLGLNEVVERVLRVGLENQAEHPQQVQETDQ
jgi:hypothetical protein